VLDLYSDEFFITVEWSVFSSLADQTVARFRTSARYEQLDAKKEGINLAFNGAFATAAGNLAEVKEFRDLLAKNTPAAAEVFGTTDSEEQASAPILLPRVPLSPLPIKRNVSQCIVRCRDDPYPWWAWIRVSHRAVRLSAYKSTCCWFG
jgi:hypothetical protein